LQLLIVEIFEMIEEYDSIPTLYVLTKYFQGYDVGYPREPLFPLSEIDAKEIISKLDGIREKVISK